MFDLLMFDLDGTLVDSLPELTDAANDVLRQLNLPATSDARVRNWIGDGARELLIRAMADTGDDRADTLRADRVRVDALMEDFAQAYLRHCGERSGLYPKVLDTLRRLQRQGIPMALVTNKEDRLTQRVVDVHGLRPFFDTIIAGDTLARPKPDPLPLLHCLELFQTRAQRALMIGDSRIDVAAAKAAGVTCWALPYGYNKGQPIRDSQPDRVIDDISAVLAAVESTRTCHQPPNKNILIGE